MMRAFLLTIFCVLMTALQAQDPREEFERARKQQSRSFSNFQAKNDSIFARFIRDSWQQMDLNEPHRPGRLNKPDSPFIFVDDLEETIWRDVPQDTSIIMRSFSPEPLESPDYFPEIRQAEMQFHGASLKMKYPVDLFDLKVRGTGKDALFHYWNEATKLGYQVVLEDLMSAKEDLRLPDYGFYLIVSDLISTLDIPTNQRVFLTWFLLNKASMACKLGYSGGNPVLLIGTNGKLYGKPYFREGALYYYAVEGSVGELSTYGNPGNDKFQPFDLAVRAPLNLPLKAQSREVSFTVKEQPHKMTLFINQNASDLVGRFPQSDIRYMLASTMNRLGQKSLEKELQPILSGLSTQERVSWLLSFVQSFSYKTDQAQFGQEKVMYPDEFLGYEFSDCDDRVVFMAYLLSEFTDLPYVAVVFPRHVALAVHLPGPAFGESLLFDGRKYTFADPTYFNAPLGAVIPEADKTKARVVKVE